MFDAVLKVAARFNHFGRALGLNASDITEIQQTFPHNRQDGLEQVINLWLQQNYNFDKYGVPSWRKLVVAVESQSGGKNRALAKKIAAEHPGKFKDLYWPFLVTFTHIFLLIVCAARPVHKVVIEAASMETEPAPVPKYPSQVSDPSTKQALNHSPYSPQRKLDPPM